MTSPIPPSKEEIEVAKERLESCMTCTWSPFAFPYTEIRTILSVLSSAEADTARLEWLVDCPTYELRVRAELMMRAWQSAHPDGGFLTMESKRAAIDSARSSKEITNG